MTRDATALSEEKSPQASGAKLFCISLAVSLLVRLIVLTVRWRMVGREILNAAVATGRPIIFVFWHEDLIGNAVWNVKQSPGRIAVMVSRSRDGERLAAVLQRLDMKPVRGSTSRGAVAGLIQMKRWLTSSGADGRHMAAVALDGPRGPRRIAQPGVVTLAHHANALIVPVAAAHSRQFVFGSWDRTKLPKPFAQSTTYIGAPIDAETMTMIRENAGNELTAALNKLHETMETAKSERR